MNNNYFHPIDCASLMKPGKAHRVGAEESIFRHIYLILMTSLGSNGFNKKYGCEIWESDFDVSVNDSNWVSKMTLDVQRNIQENEPRIASSFKVQIKIEKQEGGDNLKQTFTISISNIYLVDTNEKITDIDYNIIFSPITIY